MDNVRWRRRIAGLLWLVMTFAAPGVWASGGPLGIDHRLPYDDSGIWKRSTQIDLIEALIVGEVGCGLWEGGETRLGRTCWQSIDSSMLAGITAQVMKSAFTRVRPHQFDDPDRWFEGRGYYSFPSGEVAAVTAVVTPFVLEYRDDYPLVYAMEVLPLYDAVARMKVQAHWQTDVLAGFALGTLTGNYAHRRDDPFLLGVLPDGVEVGIRTRW